MPPRSKQHRLTIRVPDVIMASLRRQLDVTRRVVGERYSLNDLCVKKLSTGEVSAKLEQESVASRQQSGTLVIPRVPPPPPVPIATRSTLAGPLMPWQGREEPQPERAIRHSSTEVAELADAPPMPAPSDEDVDRGGEGTESAQVGVPHVGSTPTLGTNIDLERMADEGGPDGHMDD